jgi:hypothetical protein
MLKIDFSITLKNICLTVEIQDKRKNVKMILQKLRLTQVPDRILKLLSPKTRKNG